MPNGPSLKVPAPRSSRAPKTLGESNRGTQSQSTAPSGATSAPVWQFDRKAYSAIGGNGEGAAALWAIGVHHPMRVKNSPSGSVRLRPMADAPSANDSGAAPAEKSTSPSRQGVVLAALIGVAAVANLNLAVANVALPDIGKAFDASQTGLDLVAVGYSLG